MKTIALGLIERYPSTTRGANRNNNGRNRSSSGSMLPVLLLLCALAGTAEGATPWQTEVIDPSAMGKFSSLQIDADGNAHVSYVDTAQLVLKYSFWDHLLKKWFTATLDRSAGFCSLALDSKQHPHISYLDYGTARIKYIFWTGAAWEKREIRINAKDISFYTSLILDASDNPTISYYEYWGMSDNYTLRLRDVTWDGGVWAVRTIDGTPGSGKFNSMKIDLAGNPHIAYANVKDENAGLRYAHWNGRSWDIEMPEGNKQHYVYSVMLALDKDNEAHIAYTDVARHMLKYATRHGGKWQTEVVDSLREEAYPDRNGIVISDRGVPYISYYDVGLGVLKLAHKEKGNWLTEIVDENFAGFTSSLQVARGTIWITYGDESKLMLKCARRPLDASDLTSQERLQGISK